MTESAPTTASTASTASTVNTRALSVPGAELTYDVHGDLSSVTAERPPLFLIGTPMAAAGFVTLAGHMADRPVITYDPRNVGRSKRHDESVTPTPEDHAADLHAIIAEIGGPVDLFGSSGGAINGLALAIAHPEERSLPGCARFSAPSLEGDLVRADRRCPRTATRPSWPGQVARRAADRRSLRCSGFRSWKHCDSR